MKVGIPRAGQALCLLIVESSWMDHHTVPSAEPRPVALRRGHLSQKTDLSVVRRRSSVTYPQAVNGPRSSATSWLATSSHRGCPDG